MAGGGVPLCSPRYNTASPRRRIHCQRHQRAADHPLFPRRQARREAGLVGHDPFAALARRHLALRTERQIFSWKDFLF
ncbi:hypothetical protein A9P79_08325 [Cupriavidus taiwanensis]|nr:hypothetical protein A9P79_08325 [Cupriavidus taiwanensis]